jgi:hypothetical protein
MGAVKDAYDAAIAAVEAYKAAADAEAGETDNPSIEGQTLAQANSEAAQALAILKFPGIFSPDGSGKSAERTGTKLAELDL